MDCIDFYDFYDYIHLRSSAVTRIHVPAVCFFLSTFRPDDMNTSEKIPICALCF